MSKRPILVVALLVLWGWSLAGAVRIPLALPEVEDRMVRGGYLDTLNAGDDFTPFM